jgi:hypothetical protein
MAASSSSIDPEFTSQGRGPSPVPVQTDAGAEPPYEMETHANVEPTTHNTTTGDATTSYALVRDNEAHARLQLYRILQRPSVARDPEQAYEILRFLVHRTYVGVDGMEREGWQLLPGGGGDAGPATGHGQNALSGNDSTAPPIPTQSVPLNNTPGLASGHRRGVSTISDFAYQPCDSGFRKESPSEETRSAAAIEELLALLNIARDRPLNSTQTTAVNTTRNSSDESEDDAPSYRHDGEFTQWAQLREVVAAAQPGVNVTINVYSRLSPPRTQRRRDTENVT